MRYRNSNDKMVKLYHEILKNLSDKEQSDSFLTYNKGLITSHKFSMSIFEDHVILIPKELSTSELKAIVDCVDSFGFEITVKYNSFLIKDVEDSDVYILMTSDYKSYRRGHGLTKIGLNDAGWMRCYFNLDSANKAIKRKDHYYDVYKIHVKNGKILPGFTLIKGE